MRHWDGLLLDEFLAQHPKIRIEKLDQYKVELMGEYFLKAQLVGSRLIERNYTIRMVFPKNYLNELPVVYDEEGYFPRDKEFHTYDDGSFCLGSELKIKLMLQNDQSLSAFFEKVVIPFLYAVSHRIEFGTFPYGELAHGEQGLIEDYSEMFGLNSKLSILRALNALGKRKRLANKLICPCGCGLRLGLCNYRFHLNKFRGLARRRWFRHHLMSAFTPLPKPKKKGKR